MELIRYLVSTCRSSKLTRDQRDHAQSLMVELRGFGFTIHELHVLVGGKIPEPTIKKWIRNMPVKDASEHDAVIAMLGDFAQGGNELKDLEHYKDARSALEGKLSFEGCARMVDNLNDIGADLTSLYNLSKELASRGLLVPAIVTNIKLNKDLAERGLTPQIQENLLKLSEKYGGVDNVFNALEIYGEIQSLQTKKLKAEADIQIALDKEAESKRKKDALEAQALIQKTYLDIVKLLVADYSYDYDSLTNLHELAAKYGDPLKVMGAVNIYADILDLQKKMKSQVSEVATKERELEIIERKIKESETEYRKLFELNAEANQILGEIKANEQLSLRLQTISNLLQQPRRTRSSPDELSRITIALLSGVAECTKANQEYPDQFVRIIKLEVEPAISSFQNYLRVHP